MVSITVPNDLKDCAVEPRVPREGATQKDVARYVNSLHYAHFDCRTRLTKLNELINTTSVMARETVKKR